MYVRPKVYPNGETIPSSLPDSYQPAIYGEAPEGQMCATCEYFDIRSRYCNKWAAAVKPRWWCAAWTTVVLAQGKTTIGKIIINSEDDYVKLNIPLMIRLLEYAREEAVNDIDLHLIAEKLMELSENGDTLTMKDYLDIIDNVSMKSARQNNSQKVLLEINLKGK